MLIKKIVGIVIVLLNVGGIGFIIFSLGMMIKDKVSEDDTPRENNAVPAQKSDLDIVNDDIIPDEDDLLKDMDLSDLDNLDFDDFE